MDKEQRINLAAGLGPDSPVERMQVPVHIRGGGNEIPGGMYQWELSREGSVLKSFAGPAAGHGPEASPQILVSSEVLSITEEDFLSWIQGRKGLEEEWSEGPLPFWHRFVDEGIEEAKQNGRIVKEKDGDFKAVD